MSYETWFHGTNEDSARLIIQTGFQPGTYFAKHMEDAIIFGGPCVFWIRVEWERKSLDGWQQISSNHIPSKAIVGFFLGEGWFEEAKEAA
jgi:hypothetical protein